MPGQKDVPLDIKPAEQILESIGPVTDDKLIPILQQLQEAYGYLPPKLLMEVSKRTGIPASVIYGVATFYEQFYLEPRGRHTVRCCRGTACHVRGGKRIIDTIRNTLEIDEGQTTKDLRFTFETVACLGTCFLAPVIMVNNDYYGHLTGNKVEAILKRYQ